MGKTHAKTCCEGSLSVVVQVLLLILTKALQNIESQITEWSGLKGTSRSHLVQPPAQARIPTTLCPGQGPCGFRRPPEREIPQPLWVACVSALSPAQ